MKKLTAGIFATLLAVVSADGAYAAIASSGYVDDKVGVVQNAVTAVEGDVSALQTTVGQHTTQIAGKADSSTVTALDGRVKAAEGEIDTLQTEVDGKQDALGFTPENSANKTTTLSGTSTDAQYPSAKAVWDTIQTETTGIASDSDVTALKGRVGALETASANHVVKNEEITGGTHTKITYDAKGLVTAGANLTADDIPTIPNTKVSGLGSLSTKSSVATADIANKAVTEAKLSDTVNASLDLADSALQKTAADKAYAVKTLETQVGTVSKENMGTTTATTVVAGVKEAIDAAKAADAKAGSALSTAQSAQTTANAALPRATYDNQVGTVSATNMGTTATTVVTAIKEVAGEAAGAQSTASSASTAAGAAQKAAEAAQETANAAIPKPSGECASGTAKCVLTFNNSAYEWEVIARNGEGE